ncbi:Mitochondrial ribosomal protein S36 [Nesidiocoris tenuis]|uniref:Mitochondrial ribosomal protein S36 n=1 Tax=Nesidiocoris tenuis TaxID=355587 RepID=A0ABN7AGD7_9HEMI|nr:Mitochondrial ribosomal protein S36 [Nesidiocoris tenuis]
MKTSLLLRSVQAAKRTPSIKFRGGANSQVTPGRAGGSKGGSTASSSGSGQVLEDFQLPLRFRRQQIDDREIAAINSGGAL